MNYEAAKAMEAEAKRLCWHAWIDRDEGRLFPLPDMTVVRQKIIRPPWSERNRRVWALMDDEFFGKAVGVIPPLDSLLNADAYHTWEMTCAIGVWHGIGNGFMGDLTLKLTSLSGPGSTLHRSPFNVGFVHILPEIFQRRAERMWDDEGTQRCTGCCYLFNDELGEEPCDCHYLCAGCCQGARAREAIEAQTKVESSA